MYATDPNLSLDQPLRSLRVSCRNVFFGGSKNLDHFRTYIALTIRQTFVVGRHGQKHSLLQRVLVGVASRWDSPVSIVAVVSTVSTWGSLVAVVLLVVVRRQVVR
jgi:hypothetical protein